MKLGVMQPYFFPYLGYFDLINRTDKWVVFDVVQYQKKSWMNRNRVHHPATGWQYINAPVVKHNRYSRINEIQVKNSVEIRDKLLSQLEHYKKRSPYYDLVRQMIVGAFASMHGETLVELNMRTMLAVCEYLGISIDCAVFSDMDVMLPEIHHPGQWALEIATVLNANEYVNPPNGRDIFRVNEFEERGIVLTFTSLVDFKYNCAPYEFIDHLSIIDLLMFCTPSDIKYYLDQLKS